MEESLIFGLFILFLNVSIIGITWYWLSFIAKQNIKFVLIVAFIECAFITYHLLKND
ncbi:MAG: hypothetical protein PF574_01035 [Candidatus Delongbacteria bacterium]|jgi:hypothetical protein|nr:hypothetical protein [Candidatus Delongbacteria bacterium]